VLSNASPRRVAFHIPEDDEEDGDILGETHSALDDNRAAHNLDSPLSATQAFFGQTGKSQGVNDSDALTDNCR